MSTNRIGISGGNNEPKMNSGVVLCGAGVPLVVYHARYPWFLLSAAVVAAIGWEPFGAGWQLRPDPPRKMVKPFCIELSKGFVACASCPFAKYLVYSDVYYKGAHAWTEIVTVDLSEGKEIARSKPERGVYNKLVFASDGRTVAAANELRAGPVVLNVPDLSEKMVLELPKGYKSPLAFACSFSDDGQFMVGLADNALGSTAVIWELSSGKAVRVLAKPAMAGPPSREKSGVYPPRLVGVYFGEGGNIVVGIFVGQKGGIEVWDVESGAYCGPLSQPNLGFLAGMQPSSLGGLAGKMIGYDGASFRVRRMPNGQVVRLPCYRQPVVAAIVHVDGSIDVVPGAPGLPPVREAKPKTGENSLLRLESFRGRKLHTVSVSRDGSKVVTVGRGGDSEAAYACVWDTSQFVQQKSVPKNLSGIELAQAWTRLVSGDAVLAEQALLEFASSPLNAIGFLGEKFKPVQEYEQIPKLIQLLDSEDFRKREEATHQLRRIGMPVSVQLNQILAGRCSDEARLRARVLLQELERSYGALEEFDLLFWRVIDFVEYVDTPNARQLREVLAQRKVWPSTDRAMGGK